jgi:hypothetical protein
MNQIRFRAARIAAGLTLSTCSLPRWLGRAWLMTST